MFKFLRKAVGNVEKNMNILEHLEELRDCIIYSVVFLVAGCAIGSFFAKDAIDFLFNPFTDMDIRRDEDVMRVGLTADGTLRLMWPLNDDGIPLNELNEEGTTTTLVDGISHTWVEGTSYTLGGYHNKEFFKQKRLTSMRIHIYASDSLPTDAPDMVFGFSSQKPVFSNPIDPVMFWLKITILLGLVFALPLILYQVWKFVAPGLHDKERKTVIPIIFFGSLLFPAGAMFAYMALAMILDFLINFQIGNMEPMLNAWEFINLELKLMLGFGVAFELPIVLMFLTMIGLVTPEQLRKYRPYSIVIIAFLAMMLTPPDPLSMIVMMLPLFILYEISIFACIPVARRKKASEEQFEAELAEEDAKYLEEEKKDDETDDDKKSDDDSKPDAPSDAYGEDNSYNYEGYEGYDGYDDYQGFGETYEKPVDYEKLNKKRWKRKSLHRKRRTARDGKRKK